MEYHLVQLTGRPGWWWPLIGLPSLLVAMMVLLPLGWLIVFLVGYGIAGEPIEASMDRLLDLGNPTPASLAYLNLVLASLIPAVFLVQWALHGLRPGWVTSVRPRMRWWLFAACGVLSVLALAASLLVSIVLPAAPGEETLGELNDFTSTTRSYLIVVLLLTPFQAAGEEYLFRGYLTQAAGRLSAALSLPPWAVRAIAVVLPAFLFALAHGLGQSLPVFLDRFAFGVVAGVLVIRTGGLEAGIAMHVLNNFVAFGIALAFGDMSSALNPTGASWWMVPATLTQSLVYLGLVELVVRLLKVQRHTPHVAPPATPSPSLPPAQGV